MLVGDKFKLTMKTKRKKKRKKYFYAPFIFNIIDAIYVEWGEIKTLQYFDFRALHIDYRVYLSSNALQWIIIYDTWIMNNVEIQNSWNSILNHVIVSLNWVSKTNVNYLFISFFFYMNSSWQSNNCEKFPK